MVEHDYTDPDIITPTDTSESEQSEIRNMFLGFTMTCVSAVFTFWGFLAYSLIISGGGFVLTTGGMIICGLATPLSRKRQSSALFAVSYGLFALAFAGLVMSMYQFLAELFGWALIGRFLSMF